MKDFYLKPSSERISVDQLIQLLEITHDKDLISKEDRSKLIELGLSTRAEGYNIITQKGIIYLHSRDILI